MLLNVPKDEIIKLSGHDGKEIIYPDLDKPWCYRGWHIREMQDIAYKYGYVLVELQGRMGIGREGQSPFFYSRPIQEMYLVNPGIMINETHAVAFSGYPDYLIYDPKGIIYKKFDYHTFYMLIKIDNND